MGEVASRHRAGWVHVHPWPLAAPLESSTGMEHLGAHHASGEGINLSVSIPHPQQAPVFSEAGAISLATLPKTRGRLLGLSISKFTCFKKKEKKNHILISCMGAVSGLG